MLPNRNRTKYVQVTREVLNLATGAILNNYQIVTDHSDAKEEEQGTTTGPMSLGAALGMCVVPYVLPDLCKLALAVVVSRRVRPHLH